jgi:hypothetical protein
MISFGSPFGLDGRAAERTIRDRLPHEEVYLLKRLSSQLAQIGAVNLSESKERAETRFSERPSTRMAQLIVFQEGYRKRLTIRRTRDRLQFLVGRRHFGRRSAA